MMMKYLGKYIALFLIALISMTSATRYHHHKCDGSAEIPFASCKLAISSSGNIYCLTHDADKDKTRSDKTHHTHECNTDNCNIVTLTASTLSTKQTSNIQIQTDHEAASGISYIPSPSVSKTQENNKPYLQKIHIPPLPGAENRYRGSPRA